MIYQLTLVRVCHFNIRHTVEACLNNTFFGGLSGDIRMKGKGMVLPIAISSLVIGVISYAVKTEEPDGLGTVTMLLAIAAMVWIGGNICCFFYYGDKDQLPGGKFPNNEILSAGLFSVGGGAVVRSILVSVFGL
jgi:hypothetical protein